MTVFNVLQIFDQSDGDIQPSCKRSREDLGSCCRLKELAVIGQTRVQSGAVFLPSSWRSKLCTCHSCLVRLVQASVGWGGHSITELTLCVLVRRVCRPADCPSCSRSRTRSSPTRTKGRPAKRHANMILWCLRWTTWTGSSSWRSFTVSYSRSAAWCWSSFWCTWCCGITLLFVGRVQRHEERPEGLSADICSRRKSECDSTWVH